MSHRVFVALSTGQNIANLLPILELADAGDRVVWLESATAKRQGWGDGALGVLRARGVHDIDRVALANDDPSTLYRILSVHPAATGAERLCLIANGGTKLQLAAALRALEGPNLATLYNADRPCRLEQVPSDPRAPVIRSHYRRHDVDVPEILACQGWVLTPDSGGRVWPHADDQVAPTDYGLDPAYTERRHDALWAWYGRRVPETAADADKLLARPPSFHQAEHHAPAQVARFLNTLSHFRQSTVQSRQVYESALKLAQETAIALAKPDAAPPPPIGPEFEHAVLARLLEWIDAEPAACAVIQSVWRDVKVARPGSRQSVAQLDIAIALRNGILLSLECKSYDVDLKDIDARIAVLQRSASQLARMAICSPWLSGYAGRPWFADMERYAQQVGAWRQVQHLPLTLRGQPAAYADRRGAEQRVPSFEDALRAWLGPYL